VDVHAGAAQRYGAYDAWTLPPIDLWAVFPTGRRASAKARTFASFIEERLAAQARVAG
jgi:DNA-binding transcriptional LysR family regulator